MNSAERDPTGIDVIGDFLPNNYDYNILSCQVQNASETALQFDLEVRVDVSTEAEVKLFLSALNTISGCSFNIQGGRRDKRHGTGGGRSLSQGDLKISESMKSDNYYWFHPPPPHHKLS